MVFLLCAFALLCALAAGLSLCRVEICLRLCGAGFDMLRIDVRILSLRIFRDSLIPQLSTAYGFKLLMLKNGRCKPLRLNSKTGRKPPKGWIGAVLKGVHIEKLSLHGSLGIAGDAAATALLCGAITSLFGAMLLPAVGCRSDVNMTPDFCRDMFWLKLQGILRVNLWHISFELVKGRIKKHGQQHRKIDERRHGAA